MAALVVRELAALWLWGRVVGSQWPEDLGFNIAYNSFGGTVFAVDETIATSCSLFIRKLNHHVRLLPPLPPAAAAAAAAATVPRMLRTQTMLHKAAFYTMKTN